MNVIDRVDMQAAKDDADEKFLALQDFFDQPVYNQMPDEMRGLLSQQYSAYHTLSALITQYLAVLPGDIPRGESS